MLIITLVNDKQKRQIEHESGPLEFGRGPELDAPRVIIDDVYTSKNQLRLEETRDGRLLVANLSQRMPVDAGDGTPLAVGGSRVVDLPANLTFGRTRMAVERAVNDTLDQNSLQTIAEPLRTMRAPRLGRALGELGDAPAPETIASWLETVIALQQTAADTPEFYAQTARALVELVELDVGLVLNYRNGGWTIAASHVVDDRVSPHFSRTLLQQVLSARRTFYQDWRSLKVQAESLTNIDCVVVSPIFGLNDDVVGVLYGMRQMLGGRRPGGIRPLEAQIVQLLAAAVGANLARTQATRTRVQFEQFFSPELVRELERDPELLEGRNQEVTILVSDLRGFTKMSERLGPQTTCRVLRDLMERLSEQIVKHQGVIVDYAGDGILAMWNAPVAQQDHAALAGRAALAMLAEMPALSDRWQSTTGCPLALGIGLNTGVAQVGNTGSSRKLKYGPHGLTVNLASRIQDATKQLSVPLLISGATRDQLPASFECRRLPPTMLAGVTGPVVLFELQNEGVSRPRAETLARPETRAKE